MLGVLGCHFPRSKSSCYGAMALDHHGQNFPIFVVESAKSSDCGLVCLDRLWCSMDACLQRLVNIFGDCTTHAAVFPHPMTGRYNGRKGNTGPCYDGPAEIELCQSPTFVCQRPTFVCQRPTFVCQIASCEMIQHLLGHCWFLESQIKQWFDACEGKPIPATFFQRQVEANKIVDFQFRTVLNH